MKVRDAFIENHYFPLLDGTNSAPEAYWRATRSWDKDEEFDCPFNSYETMRKYIAKNLNQFNNSMSHTDIEEFRAKRLRITCGSVYVVKNESTGLYKIGRSQSVEKRIRSLETTSGCKMLLIAKLEIKTREYFVVNDAEMLYHKMFDDKRKIGEWFDLSGEDIKKLVKDQSFGYWELLVSSSTS